MSLEHLVGVAYAALLGAVLGSFANVLILRWHESATLFGRSACPECGHVIRPRHLVPVLSWILLRGRCADCGHKIHVQYPVVELAAALFGMLAALRHDPVSFFTGPMFWFEFLLTIGLIVPVVMDIRWKELPVEYLGGLSLFLGILNVAAFGPLASVPLAMDRFASVLLGITIGVGFFAVQSLLSKGKWIGMGDLWFGALIGAALGWQGTMVALYFAYLVGGGAALLGLVTGRLHRGDRLPFAPALASGLLIALWYGDVVLAWARQLFV